MPIPLPVRLQSLAIGADDIPFSGEPTLDCRMAERLADWIGNVVAPLAQHHLGTGLAAVETGPGYVCRNRNNEAAGKLSEHAKGNALDIFAFALNDGRRVAVHPTDQPTPAVAAFLAAVKSPPAAISSPSSDPAATPPMRSTCTSISACTAGRRTTGSASKDVFRCRSNPRDSRVFTYKQPPNSPNRASKMEYSHPRRDLSSRQSPGGVLGRDPYRVVSRLGSFWMWLGSYCGSCFFCRSGLDA